jgi:hypothetical protein
VGTDIFNKTWLMISTTPVWTNAAVKINSPHHHHRVAAKPGEGVLYGTNRKVIKANKYLTQ